VSAAADFSACLGSSIRRGGPGLTSARDLTLLASVAFPRQPQGRHPVLGFRSSIALGMGWRAAGPPARQTSYFLLTLIMPIKNSISRLSSPPWRLWRSPKGRRCELHRRSHSSRRFRTPHSAFRIPAAPHRLTGVVPVAAATPGLPWVPPRLAVGPAGRPFPGRHHAPLRKGLRAVHSPGPPDTWHLKPDTWLAPAPQRFLGSNSRILWPARIRVSRGLG